MGAILTAGTVAIPGATHRAGRDETEVGVFRPGEAAVELAGPFRREPAPA
ncbi:hypothetical protein [Embleya scabrispora]|nr:hypothetical protein [Embleya scabrispora]MYS86643.1 hypothetical protein [Streptomyces sp. SID5474]